MIQTQTIDIGHVKSILDNCPHYDTIIHYEYPYGDILSKKLINWYCDLIFSADANNKNQTALIQALDKSLYLYVRDNRYKRGLRKIINSDELIFTDRELLKDVIKRLIEYTINYENKEIREVTVSKWL